jgi:hypothetical protein
MRTGQDHRNVEADTWSQESDWMIFYRLPPQGGPRKEYWRVRLADVVSMETKP